MRTRKAPIIAQRRTLYTSSDRERMSNTDLFAGPRTPQEAEEVFGYDFDFVSVSS